MRVCPDALAVMAPQAGTPLLVQSSHRAAGEAKVEADTAGTVIAPVRVDSRMEPDYPAAVPAAVLREATAAVAGGVMWPKAVVGMVQGRLAAAAAAVATQHIRIHRANFHPVQVSP